MSLVDVLYYILVAHFLIVSHEFAHAAVGRLLGIRHIFLVLGMGKTFWQNASFELKVLPFGGRCRFDEESHNELSRIQKIMIAAAGPGINIIAGYCFIALDMPTAYSQIAFILGAINLVPVPRTDGWQILTQMVNKPHLSTLAINPWVTEGVIVTVALMIVMN